MVGSLVMLPASAGAQQPLQFNVPYSCQDGVTRIISRCEKNARGVEVCFWREEENGQLIGERYNVRGQMDGWLATCKAPPAQPTATPRPAAESAAPASPANRPGQPTNPAYVAGMPSPDTVKQRVQGSNAVDTLARHVAVLNRLPRIIERMRMAPERKFALTPDEQQMVNAYTLASYQLSQAYMKSATPEAFKTFQQMVARYEGDPTLNDQMMGLLSTAALADYRRVDQGASAQAQARVDQQRREAEQARALPASPAPGAPPGRNDPGTMAARRCLELGGGTAECTAKGLSTGMTDLAGLSGTGLVPGGDLFGITADNLINPAGVRIGGTFSGSGGVTLQFGNGVASLSSCGKLESDDREYTVTKRGNTLQVEISNRPQPLVVLLGPNNLFTGPATFPITGNIIVGYQTRWVEQRYTADNSVVPGSGRQERVPIYEERTLRCGFTSLRATGPAKPAVGVIGSIAGIVGDPDPASTRSGTTEAAAGPRMGGTYAGGGGLKVEFRSTAAILDCGDAHVMVPYDVQNLTDRVVVTVRNGNVPLTLTLAPDGALVGSGTVVVTGRTVTGVKDSGTTFAPVQDRCAVGSLTAR